MHESTSGFLRVQPGAGFTPIACSATEQSIAAFFASRCAAFSGRTAIQGRGAALSYAELEARSSRLADVVSHRCAGHEPRQVALLATDPILQIIAMFAVLKAGHVFVPLDGTHPPARLSAVLRHSEAALLLHDRAAPTAAAAGLAIRREVLEDALAGAVSGAVFADRHRPPGTPAYILYTSGSTGEPKGVVHSHRNVLHNVMKYTNTLGIGPADRHTLLGSFSFAISMTDIFGTLLNGAALLSYDIKALGLAGMAEWLKGERVTVFSSVPTVLRRFMETLSGAAEFPDLRLVKVSGEPVYAKDVEQFRRRFAAPTVLLNSLGCTELNTIRQFFLTRDTAVSEGVVPVGYPVEGTEVLILDEGGQEIVAGGTGEIVLRSRHLATEYWRRPDLTARAFACDPRDPELRTYKTGDRGRLRPDGCLEYLGRKDDQTKIRGFRIEPAEIEAALRACEGVRDAVVVPRETGRGPLLVAFIVPDRPGVSGPALRRRLAELLPDYMIPARFLMRRELPLLPNGKVDRRALQARVDDLTRTTGEVARPTNSVEWSVALIWQDLLEVGPVDIRKDFFDLGGDSLLAVGMMEEVARECGVALPLSVLAGGVTIQSLARAIVAERRPTCYDPLLALQPEVSRPPFYYLHGDFYGGGSYCRRLARHLGEEQPFFILHPHGLDGQSIPPTVESMAADRLTTLLAHRSAGPYVLGGYCAGGLVAFEMAQRMARRGMKVDLLILVDAPGIGSRHRRLDSVVRGLARLLCLPEGRRLDLFLRCRDTLPAWRQIAQGTMGSIRKAAREGWRTTAALMRRSGGSAVNAARLLAQTFRGGEPPAAANVLTPDGRMDRVWAMYQRATRGYVPRAYGGRVVLLRSGDGRTPGDPSDGWSAVAPDLEVRWLPGDHLTCLTEHGRTLAEEIERSLSERFPAGASA